MGAAAIPQEIQSGAVLRLRSYVWLLALIACLGAWRWIRVVFIPANTAQAQAKGRPIGNNSDLYPRWLGARELLLNHHDPYSEEVSREIQVGYYGRALDAGKPGDPADQSGFAYPVYVVFLLWPSVYVNFATVQAVSGWLLLACAAISVPLWIASLKACVHPAAQLAFTLLLCATYPLIQAYYLRQLTLFVALLLAASFAAAARGALIASGALLAVATIKPQLAAPLALALAIWTLGDWPARRRLAWSFLLSLALLCFAGELVLAGWIVRFLAAMRAYQRYAGELSLLEVLFGRAGGIAISLLLAVLLGALAWRYRREPVNGTRFRFVVCAALALDVLVLPKLAPYNQLLLVPALILLWDSRHAMASMGALARSLNKATLACLLWQWIAPFALGFLSLVLPLSLLGRFSGMPLYTVYALPVVVCLALLVLGVRRESKPPLSA